MHDPNLFTSPFFETEAQRVRENPAEIAAAVQATVQSLQKDASWGTSRENIQRVLEFLKLRREPFTDPTEERQVGEILHAGYALLTQWYWMQVDQSEGFLGRAKRIFSSMFQWGIGPVIEVRGASLYFAVFGAPTCPAMKAYDSDVNLCRKSCQERSRHALFTNAFISHALTYYHPLLKLRLYHFRDKPRAPCVYQLTLEA